VPLVTVLYPLSLTHKSQWYWYIGLFIGCIAIALATSYTAHSGMPWWALFVAILFAAIFIPVVGTVRLVPPMLLGVLTTSAVVLHGRVRAEHREPDPDAGRRDHPREARGEHVRARNPFLGVSLTPAYAAGTLRSTDTTPSRCRSAFCVISNSGRYVGPLPRSRVTPTKLLAHSIRRSRHA
jgi:hypothetical protein